MGFQLALDMHDLSKLTTFLPAKNLRNTTLILMR